MTKKTAQQPQSGTPPAPSDTQPRAMPTNLVIGIGAIQVEIVASDVVQPQTFGLPIMREDFFTSTRLLNT